MFWIGLIIVRIDFQQHHVFRSCDISTSWNMGVKNVRDRASIRVRVMELCKSRFLINFCLMTRAQRRIGLGWYSQT